MEDEMVTIINSEEPTNTALTLVFRQTRPLNPLYTKLED